MLLSFTRKELQKANNILMVIQIAFFGLFKYSLSYLIHINEFEWYSLDSNPVSVRNICFDIGSNSNFNNRNFRYHSFYFEYAAFTSLSPREHKNPLMLMNSMYKKGLLSWETRICYMSTFPLRIATFICSLWDSSGSLCLYILKKKILFVPFFYRTNFWLFPYHIITLLFLFL